MKIKKNKQKAKFETKNKKVQNKLKKSLNIKQKKKFLVSLPLLDCLSERGSLCCSEIPV